MSEELAEYSYVSTNTTNNIGETFIEMWAEYTAEITTANEVRFYIDKGSGYMLDGSYTFSSAVYNKTYHTFLGLQQSTTYKIKAEYYSSGTYLGGSDAYLVRSTTSPSVQAVFVLDTFYDGFKVIWTPKPTTETDEYEVEVRDSNGATIQENRILNNVSYAGEYRITGLSQNTSYQVYIWALKNGVYSTGKGWSNLTTRSKLTTPTFSSSNIVLTNDGADITVNNTSEHVYVEIEPTTDNPDTVYASYSLEERKHFFNTVLNTGDGSPQTTGKDDDLIRYYSGTSIDWKMYFDASISLTDRQKYVDHTRMLLNDISNSINQTFNYLGSVTYDGSTIDNNGLRIYIGPKSAWESFHTGTNYDPAVMGTFRIYHYTNTNALAYSYVLIATDVIGNYPPLNIEGVISEEVTQSLGVNNDNRIYKDSMFYDGKSVVSPSIYIPNSLDKKALEIFYTTGIPLGQTRQVTAKQLSVPFDLRVVGTGTQTFQLNHLKPNTQYRVRTWISTSSYSSYSDKSAWVTFTTKDVPFEWTYAGKNTSGQAVLGTTKDNSLYLYVTATEWKTLQDKVNQIRQSKGYPTVTFTIVTSDSQMKAIEFNEVKNAIGGMKATGIQDKSTDDDILASDFNTLMTTLNSI